MADRCNFIHDSTKSMILLIMGMLCLAAQIETVYAGTWQRIANEPQSSVQWKYLKDNGAYAISESLIDDDTRDIYTFDPTGIMYSNVIADGIFYDEHGKYQCPNARDSLSYDKGFLEFLDTGIWKFESKETLLDTMNYVSYNKLLGNPIVMITPTSDGIMLKADRNLKLMEEIGNFQKMSEMLEGIVLSAKNGAQNGREVIAKIAQFVMNKATYTMGYGTADDILKEGKGVCNAYSQLFSVLCSMAGYQAEVIPVRTISGGREKHVVNRVFLEDGTWHYYDVSGADQSWGKQFLDMNNETFFGNYELIGEGLYR